MGSTGRRHCWAVGLGPARISTQIQLHWMSRQNIVYRQAETGMRQAVFTKCYSNHAFAGSVSFITFFNQIQNNTASSVASRTCLDTRIIYDESGDWINLGRTSNLLGSSATTCNFISSSNNTEDDGTPLGAENFLGKDLWDHHSTSLHIDPKANR